MELVATASDRELERLLCDDPVRSAAVGSVLARLHEYAVLERLVEVRGSVAFRLRTPRKGEETYLLLFERSELTVVPPPGSHEAGVPEVTITCGMLEFVRLVTGGANAALLHLANRLAIDGDELLALEVGGVFRVPGKDGVAVDPKSLDPVDVAVAIAKVKDCPPPRRHVGGSSRGRADRGVPQAPRLRGPREGAAARPRGRLQDRRPCRRRRGPLRGEALRRSGLGRASRRRRWTDPIATRRSP